MNFLKRFCGWLAVALLAGCTSPEPVDSLEVPDDAMLVLGVKPETLLFPDYLFIEGLELDQHGRIPDSRLIGANFEGKLSVDTVFERFSNRLVAKGWSITKAEKTGGWFRLQATLQDEGLEIRGVRGDGPTHVYLLYQPAQIKVPRSGD